MHAMSDMNFFERLPEIQSTTYFADPAFQNVVTICHINYPGHIIS